jgi:hypothetical protein
LFKVAQEKLNDEVKDKLEFKNKPYSETVAIPKEYSEIVEEIWTELKLYGYLALSDMPQDSDCYDNESELIS